MLRHPNKCGERAAAMPIILRFEPRCAVPDDRASEPNREAHPLYDAETRAFAERNAAPIVLGEVARVLAGILAVIAIVEIVLKLCRIQ